MFEKLNSLDDLLLHEVQDMYHAEKQLVKALPDVAEQATSPELKGAIEEHLQQTKVHVNRLERIFEMLGQEPKATKCKAMKGILDEEKATDQKLTELAKAGLNQRAAAKQPQKQFAE